MLNNGAKNNPIIRKLHRKVGRTCVCVCVVCVGGGGREEESQSGSFIVILRRDEDLLKEAHCLFAFSSTLSGAFNLIDCDLKIYAFVNMAQRIIIFCKWEIPLASN